MYRYGWFVTNVYGHVTEEGVEDDIPHTGIKSSIAPETVESVTVKLTDGRSIEYFKVSIDAPEGTVK